MSRIYVLDSTLRDGGYCNQWKFGFKNIRKILHNLQNADINIIECGFLSDKVQYDQDISKFSTIEEIRTVIPEKKCGKFFVAMINFGDYEVGKLPEYDGSSIDGIRVAFHKNDRWNALDLCAGIASKGYKVFIQAMVSMNYSEEEFLELIERVNEISPYAFYIVDSFGMMKKKDMIRFFYLVEHRLKDSVYIGFHSHNNMQMAFANAQTLVEIPSNRVLIIDTSIMGMGRGAGNLNTELFVEYLNDNYETNYSLKPLLQTIDEVLNNFYQKNYWGYSLPNYLSAIFKTHPNYAEYLVGKNTLTIENMEEIFSMMSDDKRYKFNKNYIESLYLKYMDQDDIHENCFERLDKILHGKRVLVIAPGKSTEEEEDLIVQTMRRSDVVSITLNFDYSALNTDYIFVSNKRRFKEISKEKYRKCIVTSNISAQDVYMRVEYRKLLNTIEAVKDNSGMMLIKLLIQSGVKEILLAGMDGYSLDADQNYADEGMQFFVKRAEFEAMNKGIIEMLKYYGLFTNITFITTPRHISI